MDEEKIGFYGETPVDVHEVQATDLNTIETEWVKQKSMELFSFNNLRRARLSTEGELIFSFLENNEQTDIPFTLAEMQALQRVARAQIELEKRRGREG
jgi:two-component SAPR family response regulator